MFPTGHRTVQAISHLILSRREKAKSGMTPLQEKNRRHLSQNLEWAARKRIENGKPWQKCEENGDDGWATPNPASSLSQQVKHSYTIPPTQFPVLFYSAYLRFFWLEEWEHPSSLFWLVFLNNERPRSLPLSDLEKIFVPATACPPLGAEFFPFLLLESHRRLDFPMLAMASLFYLSASQQTDHLGVELWRVCVVLLWAL